MRPILYIFLICGIVLILATGIIARENVKPCGTKDTVIIKGQSLSPLIEQGTELTILWGYQKCGEIQRDDIVAYAFAGKNDPIIKIVKAVPGDAWYVTDKKIFVNNEILSNSQDQAYYLSSKQENLLKHYAKSYPVIPSVTFLLLGNGVTGNLDSRRFGLVSKDDILGKIDIT